MHMPEHPRAGIYARFSSDLQNPKSAEDQIALCKDAVGRQGWRVGPVFSDEATSGAYADREGYDRMIEAAMARQFDVLVAEDLSRLSRGQGEIANLYEILDGLGIRMWTVADGLISEIHIAFKGGMNAMQLKALADQVRRGHRALVLKRRNPGGRIYGYRNVKRVENETEVIRGLLVIDEDQKDIIIRIFEEYAAGKSIKQIVAGLNRDNIKPPRGKVWKVSTINGNRKRGTGILNNERYIGVIVWNRQQFKGVPAALRKLRKASDGKPGNRKQRSAFPNDPSEFVRTEAPELRIVPQELWNRVKARQQVLDERIEQQKARSGGKDRRAGIGAARHNLTILGGLLYCGECGHKMTRAGGDHLRCSHAAETGGSACSHTRCYPRAAVEGRVLAVLGNELMQAPAIETFLRAYNAEVTRMSAARARAHKTLASDLARIETEISNVVDAVAAGFANATLKIKLESLEAEKVTLTAKLAEPAPKPISFLPNAAELYRQRIAQLEQALRHPESGDAAREAARALIGKAIIRPRPDVGKKAFDLQLEGALAALLQMAGMRERDAAVVDATSRSSGQLVAGVGFEPTTFRL